MANVTPIYVPATRVTAVSMIDVYLEDIQTSEEDTKHTEFLASISLKGVRELISAAHKYFVEQTGQYLPTNLDTQHAWYTDWTTEQKEAELVRCARVAGWLRAAVAVPGIKTIVGTSVISGSQYGGYGNRLPVYAIVDHYRNPYDFARKWFAVERKLKSICPKDYYQQARRNIAVACISSHATNKAAIIAMGGAIAGSAGCSRINYSWARRMLERLSMPVGANTVEIDGIKTVVYGLPLNKAGLTAQRGIIWVKERPEHSYRSRKTVWVVTHTASGRQTHLDREFGYVWASSNAGETGISVEKPIEWKKAIKHWRDYDIAQKRTQQLEAAKLTELEQLFIDQTNQTTLVWFTDSLDAGNCSPGTRSWMGYMGIQKQVVRYVDLVNLYMKNLTASGPGDDHVKRLKNVLLYVKSTVVS
jgi:hypothetical protein